MEGSHLCATGAPLNLLVGSLLLHLRVNGALAAWRLGLVQPRTCKVEEATRLLQELFALRVQHRCALPVGTSHQLPVDKDPRHPGWLREMGQLESMHRLNNTVGVGRAIHDVEDLAPDALLHPPGPFPSKIGVLGAPPREGRVIRRGRRRAQVAAHEAHRPRQLRRVGWCRLGQSSSECAERCEGQAASRGLQARPGRRHALQHRQHGELHKVTWKPRLEKRCHSQAYRAQAVRACGQVVDLDGDGRPLSRHSQRRRCVQRHGIGAAGMDQLPEGPIDHLCNGGGRILRVLAASRHDYEQRAEAEA
mmetsp:Transcript_46702/g.99723  ORF Transcript_46702/g.99723 Transcript_46702/m.99723 type:complete len:306 (-) Transcript_46702:58-975(-)